MKLLIVAVILSVSSAAQLPKIYLPQNGGNQQALSSQNLQNTGGASNNGNSRPQQEQDKNAQIIKQEQEINENGFYYTYETSNGIKAEENGNANQSQGGFSYIGDDGNTYSVTFTAGEDGFRPQGDHLPVPPPPPQAILDALEQNEKDEAAGIFDDGQYRPDVHGGGQNRPGQSGSDVATSSHQGNFNANSGYRY
ncbi:pupal cuticle protein 27-like [Achroia grisella]|uniref:pupal cuticle protein 27-like n=1 Tax=Achroia grisella TaxID=688607 RepID=UPI0027D253B5|nr:pupal cuticle protein 27-like [Achroia grisella]